MNVSFLNADLSSVQKCTYALQGEENCQLFSVPCNEVKDCSRKKGLIRLAKSEGKYFDNGFIKRVKH